MVIDGALLASQVTIFEFTSYVRVIPTAHAATPIGCAGGNSRFGGSTIIFAALYAAHNLATALAETVVRDRFEGLSDRRLFLVELTDRTAVELYSKEPLRVVDLRKGGCLKMGISTDIAGAKKFVEAQHFSDLVYKDLTIDGILYASRLTGENCVAVFDRAVSRLVAVRCAPLIQISQIGLALESLNIKLIS